MPFEAGQVYRLTVQGISENQQLNNIWFAEVAFASDPGITPAQLAEAWWNHVKAAYRGIATTPWVTAFTNILCEQVDAASGAYGNYPIPVGEQPGTRSPGVAPANVPSSAFTAIGMRLNVGTKATRPGQKRFWGLVENDMLGNGLEPAPITAANVLGAILDDNIVLGSPAALTEVHMVVRQSGADDVPQVNQRIISASVSNRVRSQVSRRVPAF